MEKQYVCSEIAVQKILKEFGISPKIATISRLKECESLENMRPCVESIIKDANANIHCNLYTNVSLNYLAQNASKSNPIAIRVNQSRNPFVPNAKNDLHTINIIGYENGNFAYDEEDGSINKIPQRLLDYWRHGNYAFICKL